MNFDDIKSRFDEIKNGQTYDEVPIVKLTPEELALGEILHSSKKVKQQLMDDSYNR